MAAPSFKTLQNLNGQWKLNKDLSDDYTSVLQLQGVNAMIRKVSSAASIHLRINQSSSGNEVYMEQSATAVGIPGASEHYVLDWQWRDTRTALFGDVQGRSRWIDSESLLGSRSRSEPSAPPAAAAAAAADDDNDDDNYDGDDDDLATLFQSSFIDWADDCKGPGKQLIQAVGKASNGSWTATHLWGFELIDGVRRHTRRVYVQAENGEELRVRMVYDFESD